MCHDNYYYYFLFLWIFIAIGLNLRSNSTASQEKIVSCNNGRMHRMVRRLRQWYDDLYICDWEVSGTSVCAAFEPVLVDPVQQYYCLALLKKKKDLKYFQQLDHFNGIRK